MVMSGIRENRGDEGVSQAQASGPGPDQASIPKLLCLDFTLTAEREPDGKINVESITSYADLVSWCNQTRILTNDDLGARVQDAQTSPREATKALARALALREAIYCVFSAIARRERPRDKDLADLNSALARAVSRSRIVATEDGFTWSCSENCDALDRVFWPVIWSATDLLTSTDRKLVRVCNSSACNELFLDTSRNRTRRWCDMKVCGNRAKAQRHYKKRKKAAPKA